MELTSMFDNVKTMPDISEGKSIDTNEELLIYLENLGGFGVRKVCIDKLVRTLHGTGSMDVKPKKFPERPRVSEVRFDIVGDVILSSIPDVYKDVKDSLISGKPGEHRSEKVFANKDFGVGFYTTCNYGEAELWGYINRNKDGKGGQKGVGYIHEFGVCMDELEVLYIPNNCLLSYIAFVLDNNAPTLESEHEVNVVKNFINKHIEDSWYSYDVIIGPRLDSRYNKIIEDFSAGVLSVEGLAKAMELGTPDMQICFRTKKALDRLVSSNKFELVNTVKSSSCEDEYMDLRLKYNDMKHQYTAGVTIVQLQ